MRQNELLSKYSVTKQDSANNRFKLPESETTFTIPEWSALELAEMKDANSVAYPEPEQNDAEVLANLDEIIFSPIPKPSEFPGVKLDGIDYEFSYIPTLLPEDLWLEMRKNFKLDLTIDNSRIDSQYNWYARHQSYGQGCETCKPIYVLRS